MDLILNQQLESGNRRIVTYSPAYTLVPTYECFNQCQYCNFRAEPSHSPWLTLEDATQELQPLRQRVSEILILSGEVHPHSSRRHAWLQRIYDLCKLALTMGFLPHTNAGPLSFAEMEQLKPVNVSMGLMLEQITPRLLETVHRHAPSKVPELRLQQLVWAGELRIPFTTGLLLGIGETTSDRTDTLMAIREIHQQYGHIQEVILQPYSPGHQQSWAGVACQFEDLIATITTAREILPAEITIQIPPNLCKTSEQILAALQAGARDLGGIGPQDRVDPDYPHPTPQWLASFLRANGWQLIPRLPVYPQYVPWLSKELQAAVAQIMAKDFLGSP